MMAGSRPSRTGRLLLGHARLLAAGLVLACASTKAPTLPSSPQPPRSADDVSLLIFANLQKDDAGAAAADFSPRMSRALSLMELRGVWVHLISELGPLRSFTIAARGRKRGLETRTIALSFERGAARGEVAVDPSTGEVEGLFVRPAAAG